MPVPTLESMSADCGGVLDKELLSPVCEASGRSTSCLSYEKLSHHQDQ